MSAITNSTSNLDSSVQEALDAIEGFQPTKYTKETSKFCCSSLKAKKIAASTAFGMLAVAGATVAGVVPLDLASLSVIIGATVICAIASTIFARNARRESSETIQEKTADFRSIPGIRTTVQVKGRAIEFETPFQKDFDWKSDEFLIKTPQGTQTIKKFFNWEFWDFERKIKEAGDKEALKEAAKKELKDAVTIGFIEYLMKELGPNREHLIPEITSLFSQNLKIEMNNMKDILGSTIISKRKNAETEVSLNGKKINYTLTLAIPKEGPVKIVVRGKGNIEEALYHKTSEVVIYRNPHPFQGKTAITIGLDGINHLHSRISLAI
jgi:hypothetical protein